MSMEVFDLNFIALLTGQDGLTLGDEGVYRRFVVEVPASGTVTLDHAPTAGTLTIRPVNSDNTTFSGPSMDNGVEFDLSEDTITFEDEFIGARVAINYIAVANDVETLTVNADRFASAFKIVGDAEMRSYETGADRWIQVQLMNARPQSSFTIDFSGDVTTIELTFDLMVDTDGDMAKIALIPDGETGKATEGIRSL